MRIFINHVKASFKCAFTEHNRISLRIYNYYKFHMKGSRELHFDVIIGENVLKIIIFHILFT